MKSGGNIEFPAIFNRLSDRFYRSNFKVIGQIWQDSYPPERPKQHRLIEKILLTPVLTFRAFSLSNLAVCFETKKGQYTYIDIYVLLWMFLLTTFVWIVNPGQYVYVYIVAYRVVDILSYQLAVILIDSQKPDWKLGSLRSSLLSSLVNLYEIVCAFAVIYLVLGSIKSDHATVSDPITAFYYSIVTMATLGYGEFIPYDSPARIAVTLQLLAELLFLLVFIPVFSANVITQLQARERNELNDK